MIRTIAIIIVGSLALAFVALQILAVGTWLNMSGRNGPWWQVLPHIPGWRIWVYMTVPSAMIVTGLVLRGQGELERCKMGEVENMNEQKQIAACLGCLDKAAPSLAGAVTAEPDSPITILRALFDLGRKTLLVMHRTIDIGDDAYLCLPTICRPYWEVSVRALWASREPNGWDRQCKYFAREQEKHAERAVKFEEWRPHYEPRLAMLREILRRSDSRGKRFPNSPPVDQLLKANESRDIREEITGKVFPNRGAEFRTVALWLAMCAPSHGQVMDLNYDPRFHLKLGTSGAIDATANTLRACGYASAGTQEERADVALKMANDMYEILRLGNEDLAAGT